jgi:predicted tellurium resistance membrane protein TerC
MELFTLENLGALLTLSALEIVLGIDNIVVLAIITGKLPAAQRPRIRRLGLAAAMLMRIGLLLSLSWMMRLTAPLFTVLGHGFSGRDLILIAGGLFLIFKATREIYTKVEALEEAPSGAAGAVATSAAMAIVQIMIFDLVFSLDSVITAIGMAQEIWVMVLAIMIAIGVMMLFANPVSDFVERHPSIKILALAFLLLIGVMLIVEGMGGHFDRGYVYAAMTFSLFVEMLNMRSRARTGSRSSGAG